ncbi:MAG: ATP-binding cassette domain-containing protein [Proteobacteria bacterium]|nr:ATP-binding cassette domain-containing protein [Pseudomonadota bacterium]
MYLRILKLLPTYKLHFSLAIMCMFAFALSTGALAYIIGPVMKFLFTSGTTEEIGIVPFGLVTIPKEQMIFAVPVIIMLVAVVKGISSFGQIYFMGHVGQGLIRDLRFRLYVNILNMPISFFHSYPSGVLMSRITNDVNMLQSTASESFAAVIKQSLTLVVLGAVIVSLDWKLALVAFVGVPLAVYPLRKFGKKMNKVSTKGQVTLGNITALLQEAITGVRIVKAFGMEKYEAERFNVENKRYTKWQLKTIKVRATSSPLMETIGAVGFALTIWYAAFRIANGELRPENFISFFAATLMFYQPLKALNGVNLSIQNGLAAATRVFEMLDLPNETSHETTDRKLEGINEGIEFDKVSFKYEDKWILKDVNVKVPQSEMVAIVGSSGAGKSTFVNLLPRFYDINEGSLMIDGVDIREFTLKSLRANISIVSQQVILFNDTIRCNISYGDRDKSEEEIIAAAKAANAHQFISKLPDGYDTVIGESGLKLSGGERQRMSIARAILKNAPLLILDEATSSLDTESELEVQRGLENLMAGRTTVVIAHRLSTIRNADKIVVLSGGRVCESGTHDELLEAEGEYHRLYTMQFRDEEPEEELSPGVN